MPKCTFHYHVFQLKLLDERAKLPYKKKKSSSYGSGTTKVIKELCDHLVHAEKYSCVEPCVQAPLLRRDEHADGVYIYLQSRS